MGSGYRTFTAGEVLTASNVQNYLQDQAVMVFADSTARATGIGTANFQEGMLTYLTDVDKLQVYTGATFEDVYPSASSGSGLTLINSTTATGAISSISINDVFSATYKNYLITISPNGAVAGAGILLNFKFRASGSDISTGYGYVTRVIGFSDGSESSIGNSSSSTLVGLGYLTAATNQLSMSLTVYNPYEAVRKSLVGHGIGTNVSDSTYLITQVGGTCNSTSALDGFSLIRSSGTGLELTIKTYGMAN
jgi:hypothetical protein